MAEEIVCCWLRWRSLVEVVFLLLSPAAAFLNVPPSAAAAGKRVRMEEINSLPLLSVPR